MGVKLSFNVFGFEVATLRLDGLPGESTSSEAASVVSSIADRAVESASRAWMRHLFKPKR